MIKLRNQKEPLKKRKNERTRNSINERWMKDAEWFREDAKNHPDKYQPKNDEKRVSSEELEEYLNDFIKEGNQRYSTKEDRSFIRPRIKRSNQYRARVVKIRKAKNNKTSKKIKKY
ncbi:hypothetical protein [Lacicoccus qingdaonensis]|uniref:Uncharacterized protein n=1 Tax=Lacicoccus qingdaonensis TaxID=576118 RepID=A0A1G9FQD8_9BACL|nr:hypothetical protein [Salinicoccus qingdaonensis]SDK90577.1 hypothetical protein SAMN05216216_11350 [Salinicoccus qingdaonensis]